MLTKKQGNILSFIQSHFKDEGLYPSVRDIAKHFELTATAIQQHINALKKKGVLLDKKADTAAYALSPESVKDLLKQSQLVSDSVSFSKQNSLNISSFDTTQDNLVDFPDTSIHILGNIAAGHPVSSELDEEQTLHLSPEFFDSSKMVFGLYVSGDSMVGDHICDGDVAIIKRESSYKPHDIVAVRVDNDEFTLKRVEKKGDFVSLIPSNPSFSSKQLKADRVDIIGKYLGLIRKG